MISVTETAAALSTFWDILVGWGGQKATLGREGFFEESKSEFYVFWVNKCLLTVNSVL